MPMTEEERFRFDLTGFLVRPAILTPDETDAIVNQLRAIKDDPQSLPPEERVLPGGAASLLIDHPRIVDVLHEIIGPQIRLEVSSGGFRTKGSPPGAPLHMGGPTLTDPLIGYRSQNGQIQAGAVRVIIELTEVDEDDGATAFLVGSHKANFPIHPEHLSLELGQRSPFLRSYSCPAGSAIFFTEAVCHGAQTWMRDEPRAVIFSFYNHVAINFHRVGIPPEVIAALPREKQAYFRQPWLADFRPTPAVQNTLERFVEGADVPMHIEEAVAAR